MIEHLKAMLRRHEGFVSKPAPCPAGFITGGYGHNYEAHGEPVPPLVTREKAEYMLDMDIQKAIIDCACYIGPFVGLDPVRQAVLINMCFQMGIGSRKSKKKGLLSFKNMLAAISAQDWNLAAKEMLDSDWGRKFKRRADELARMMETGEWPAAA